MHLCVPLAIIEDSDEYEAFHKCLHVLLRCKQFSEKEMQIKLEIVTCYPTVFTINHPKFIVSSQKGESIST